jgi:hypothetical protein
MDRADLERWLAGYERLWRSAGTEGLGELFSTHATYRVSPWAEPIRGLDAIAGLWEDERDGADEQFTTVAEVVAVDGDVGVARVEVDYAKGERWRDLWIVRCAEDGRCVAFEEWPIAPDEA